MEQDNAYCYEGYEYEDYTYEDYGDLDGDKGRPEMTNAETTDATSNTIAVKGQKSKLYHNS